MQFNKSLRLGILALLFVVLTIFPGCGGGGGTTPPINHSPVISGLTANPSSIDTNQTTTITCTASDEDGDTLTYTYTKTSGTITGTGSAITWTAPATAGTYTITCIVSDGNGGQDSESINIVVTESDENKIKNVIHKFCQAFNDKDWNTAKSYCVYGSEIYQEIVGAEQCYNLYGAYECDIPDEFIVNNINPIIINSDYAEAYVYLTTIWSGIGDSGELWLYLQKIGIDWRLYGAGGTTPLNNAPVITSTAITSVTLPAAYTYDVDATDSNGDTLIYSLNTAPAGMTIEVHTGVINWAPTVAYVGIHSVIVEVSDGELTDTQTFIITVLAAPIPVNNLPIINSFSADPTTITVGESSVLTWSITDANSVTINNGVGSVTFSGDTMVNPVMTTTYTLTATNSAGSVTAMITVTVHSNSTISPIEDLAKETISDFIISADCNGDEEPDFGWNSGYDISFVNQVLHIEINIQLEGDDPGVVLKQQWEDGIEGIWSNKYDIVDRNYKYPIKLQVNWVDANPHHIVNIYSGSGYTNMLNWYTVVNWGAQYQDEIAAHEAGHMLGLYDEYNNGALDPDTLFTTTNSLMADLGPTRDWHYEQILEWLEARSDRDLSLIKSTLSPYSYNDRISNFNDCRY